MKFLIRLIDRLATWYRRKRDALDREEMQWLSNAEAECSHIPITNQAIVTKSLAHQWRNDGKAYHAASLRYLSANPDKDFVHFDMLPIAIKEIYFKNDN